MNSESKQCQNCKVGFLIEAEDFDFYRKIDVPPPTWCPDCRQQRRYAWRNERILYRRKCDLCGKSLVTIYSENKPFKVYCPPCWWSDRWSGFDYGKDFDFARAFFDQFRELQRQVPRIALLTKNSTDSEYTNHSSNNKNCYLSFSVFNSENVLYSTNVWDKAQDCCDCYIVPEGGILLYECIDTERSYKCQYGILLRDCANCFYCFNCRNCSDCFLSSGLRGKQYYFLNQPNSKEEYVKKMSEYQLGLQSDRAKLYQMFLDLMRDKTIHRFATIEQSSNVSGNMIFNSKNAHHVFDANGAEDTKYGIICPDVKDTMDSYHYGFKCELNYECHALLHDYNVLFSHLCYDNSNLAYCDSCHNSQNLFGCAGIRQGEYCVFNKKYSPSEYGDLKKKIIGHMKKTGEFGEFFPPKLSPFGYNETQGQVYMPLSREETLRRGWNWEDKTPGTFGKETIAADKIPAEIQNVSDDILKEVLVCSDCRKNYNIVKPELDFYRSEAIPIPRLCPSCRYARRIGLKLPRKLWKGKCRCGGTRSENGKYVNAIAHSHDGQPCPNEFETSYAPDRPEIVYCESCYNSEIA